MIEKSSTKLFTVPLHPLLENSTGLERDHLPRRDVEYLTGFRIPTQPRRFLPHTEHPELGQLDSIPLLQRPADHFEQRAKEGSRLAL